MDQLLRPFSRDQLFEVLATFSGTSRDIVMRKRQCDYLADYLSELGARTILVERDYVDRDYLEDFAGYYVRCFSDYPRKCTRLHFLSEEVGQGDFEFLLQGREGSLCVKRLREFYLGFVVLKPLPSTIIGRTCLRAPVAETRRFPVLSPQPVNLFGWNLQIETLPFQEQDSVVAACATSALWSAFQYTGRRFQHRVPTPVEITRLATEHAPSNTRYLPTRGLTPEGIAQAIRAVGLEPHYVQATHSQVLMPTVYAYLRGRIPVFLSMGLYSPPAHDGEPYSLWGGTSEGSTHGVLVTGYSLERAEPIPGANGFLLEANRLAALYVHDDQVGPFCELELDWKNIPTKPYLDNPEPEHLSPPYS
jgi:hypothetical protein